MQSFDSSSPLRSLASTPSYSGSDSDGNQGHSNQSPKRKQTRGPRKNSREKLETIFALLRSYRWTLTDLLIELQHASHTSTSWASTFTRYKNFIYQDPVFLEANLSSEDWSRMLDAVKWEPVKSHLRKEIRTLGKSNYYGFYRGVEDIGEVERSLLLPIETARTCAPVFLEVLQEVTKPLQPSTRDKPVSRYAFMLYQMCYTQQRANCDRFATLLGIYLNNAGLRKRAQKVLATLGVCSGYDHTSGCLKELIDAGASEVARIGTSLAVVTTYDNWEMAEKVNEIRFGDNQTFLSATTGLISEGTDMPETGLSRDAYDPCFQLHTEDLINTGLAESNVQENIWRFYIFESIRSAFPDAVSRMYDTNQSLKPPDRPVIDRVSIPSPHHQPLKPSMLNESTNANNLQIIDDFFHKQMKMSPDDVRFNELYFLMIGDQKTVAQWRSIKATRCDARRPYDRLQWLLPVFGLWHFKFNFLQLLHSLHWLDTSHEESTLWTAAKHWGRKNLSTAKDFKSLEHLVIHSFQSRVIGLLISHIRHNQEASSIPLVKDRDVLAHIGNMTASTLDWLLDKILEDIRMGQKPAPTGEVGIEWQNHMTYLHHAMSYLVLKDSIKYGDIGLLRVVMNTCCVLFQGASSHPKYARELLYFVHLTSSKAASAELQRAVLSNSLVNSRGQRDSFYEKDRRLEFHNGYLKELKIHHRTSSLSPDILLKRYSLLVPSFYTLSNAMETAYKAKQTGHHAYKPVREELLSLALLLCKRSLRRYPRAVSKAPVQNLYYMGLKALETKVQEFNKLIQDDEDNEELQLEDQEVPVQLIESIQPQLRPSQLYPNDSDSDMSVASRN